MKIPEYKARHALRVVKGRYFYNIIDLEKYLTSIMYISGDALKELAIQVVQAEPTIVITFITYQHYINSYYHHIPFSSTYKRKIIK